MKPITRQWLTAQADAHRRAITHTGNPWTKAYLLGCVHAFHAVRQHLMTRPPAQTKTARRKQAA